MADYNRVSLRDIAALAEQESTLKVSSDIQRKDIVLMGDELFFDKVTFAFGNNRYTNAFFINDIKDREYSDITSSANINYNVVESTIKLIDPAQDGTYVSTSICTDKGYNSDLNKFFLIAEEDVPPGCDILYYLITDDDRVFPLKPNATVPLEIVLNKPKSFKIKAEFYCNGIDYPAIKSFAVLYHDQFIEDSYGLINPNFSKNEDEYNGFEDRITLVRDPLNQDKLVKVISALDTVNLTYDLANGNRLMMVEQFDNLSNDKLEQNDLIYGDYLNSLGEVEEVLLQITSKTSFEDKTK